MSNQITPNPSVPSQLVAEVKFPKFINNLGIIPTSYKDSMSYYETLAWLCKFLEEQVIPTVNENGEAVKELQALYIELNSYVTHYFDNLDVQEEINNKLDEMTEAGTLEEIISAYLNSTAIWGFNTVNDMKQATNLINGSFARTLGYTAINDSGSALYKIRTKDPLDVPNNGDIISLSETLVAELIPQEYITPEMFGAIRDGETDDFSALNNCINYSLTKRVKIKLNAGTYYISEPLDIQYARDLYIEGTHGAWSGSSIIKSDTIAIKCCGAHKWTIKGVYFISQIGIQFYERDVHTMDSRTYNCIIEDCIFNCTTSGIDVETLNGYMYIKHNTFRPKTRGIGLGINYTNLTNITAPNYFYIEENNFLPHNDITELDDCIAIDFYYATYVFISKNDIVTKIGLNFSNQDHVCSNLRVINNSFFENIYVIKADINDKVLKDVLFSNNTFRLNASSYGLDISSSNNQLVSLVGNYFETTSGSVTPQYMVKYYQTSTAGHVFSGNMAQNLTTGVCNLCTFPSQIKIDNSMYFNHYTSLTAGQSKTYTLGSKYSWIANANAQCTNDNITLTNTVNADGSITVVATNNTESLQRGIIFTAST